MTHPDEALIPWLRGELPEPERAHIARHVEACAACRRTAGEIRRVLDDLADAAAAVPEPHWGRFRAELRARIDARTRRPRWLAPLPLAASAALAVVLGALAVELAPSRPAPDLVVVEEVAVGSDLDLVRRYPVLDHLELLENFEVIDQLDVLASRDG